MCGRVGHNLWITEVGSPITKGKDGRMDLGSIYLFCQSNKLFFPSLKPFWVGVSVLCKNDSSSMTVVSALLAPGIGFMEDNFSMHWGWGVGGMVLDLPADYLLLGGLVPTGCTGPWLGVGGLYSMRQDLSLSLCLSHHNASHDMKGQSGAVCVWMQLSLIC